MLTSLQGVGGRYSSFGLLLLLMMSFAYQAGSSVDVITRLVELDGELYALDTTENGEISSISPDQADLRQNLTARYNPELDSWEPVLDVPDEVYEKAIEGVERPKTVCVTDDPSICYRIEEDVHVLESEDGGENWKTSWKIPAGRLFFMTRASRITKSRLDPGPYDLIISNQGDGNIVLAALGNEGVVMRKSDGPWERQGVGSARPTPYRATTLLEIMVTIPTEMGGWLIFVAVYGIGQYIYFLRRLRYIFPPLTFAFLIFITGGLILAYRILGTGEVNEFGLLLLVVLTYCVPIYLAYRKWNGESYKLDYPAMSEKAAWYWLWSTLGLFFGGILLLCLWPLGLVPFYLLMVMLVLGTAVGMAWWGSTRISVFMSDAGGWQ